MSPRTRRRGSRPLAVLLALLTAVAGLVSVAAPAQAADEVTFLGNLDFSGSGISRLPGIWDVETGPNGDVYVASYVFGVVQFTEDGTFVRRLGNGDGAYGVDIDEAGNVYVAGQDPARVSKFAANGALLDSWTDVGTSPYAIAVAPDGSVYVTNSSTVVRLDAEGRRVTEWGSSGTGQGQFHYPYGIHVDAGGVVWVSDFGLNRIQKFTANGAYLSTINGLVQPIGISSNASGDYIVGEWGSSRFRVFSADGTPKASWSTDGDFVTMFGVSMDDQGLIYASDSNVSTNPVKKFSLDPVFAPFTPTISGSGRAGDELSVSATTRPAPASWSYAWTVSGDDEVRSTGTTFTPGLADVGETVTVSVTAHGTDGEPRDRTGTATQVVAGKLMDTTVTIVDSTPDTAPTTGDVLSVEVDESQLPDDSAVTVRWGRFAAQECTVEGDVADDYTVRDADAGAMLCAQVTSQAAGHETLTKTAVADAAAVGTFTAPAPAVDVESPVVGSMVTASVDLEDAPEGAEVTAWQWGVVEGEDCSAIDGANQRTFTPDATDFEKTLCVTVTVSAPHRLDATSTVTVGEVGAGEFGQSPVVTIPEWVQVGMESSASVTGGDPAEAERTYQWNVDGEPVEGATSATYTPKAADEGRDLSVTVTSSATGHLDDVTTSSAVEIGSGDFGVPEPVPSTQRPAVGQPVTLPIDLTSAPEGAEAHWRWGVVADEQCVEIDGATTDTFTPTPGQVGEVLCVEAGVTAPGYRPIGGTLVLEQAVVRGTLPAIRPVLSTSRPKVGAKLTASLFATALPEGATTTVSWGYSRANTACRPSAAAASFTTTSAMVGRKVCALVTVSAPGYADSTAVLTSGLVTETGLMTVTPRTIKGTQRFTVRAQGLKPGERFQIMTAGKDVRGRADSYGRVVRTIKYGKGLQSKTRVVGVRGYNAQGRTTFAKKVKVTYRTR